MTQIREYVAVKNCTGYFRSQERSNQERLNIVPNSPVFLLTSLSLAKT